MILQLVLRQIFDLRSKHKGKCLEAKIIKAVAYVQPLNARRNLMKHCIGLKAITEIKGKNWA